MTMVKNHECALLKGPSHTKLDRAVRLGEFANRLLPDSIAIVVSNPEQTRSNDTEFPYRQSSDVVYLNGFPEPDSVLIVSTVGGKRDFVMLVRPKDREREIWTGIRAGVQGAKKDYLADEAYPIDKFAEVVGSLIGKATNVYYRFGVNGHFDEQFRKVWEPTQKPLLNPNDILHEMRLFKSEREVEILRHAGAISAEAHRQAMMSTRPGMYEHQVQAVLEYVFRYHGATSAAYGSIVASGNNAVVLHYNNNNVLMKDGDLLLVDAACEYGGLNGGYASDITRCWPVNGKFSEGQREIYQLVLDAQLAAIKVAKPGVPLARVHQTACRVLRNGLKRLGVLPETSTAHGDRSKKNGKGKAKKAEPKPLRLDDFYMHGTSHWMGLDVHDVGSYQTKSGLRTDKGRGKRRVLEPGMVFTIEPGLYFDKNDRRVPKKYRGIGVRIEDDVVITATGNEILTADVPKEIAEIESLMSAGRQSDA